MSEGELAVVETAPVYGDGPGEVCPRRQGVGAPLAAPDAEAAEPGGNLAAYALNNEAQQAAPLPARPWYRILVTVTPLNFEAPQPVAHYTPQKFRTIEAADIEAAALYEDDYLPKRELMGTVAVVEMRPGGTPIVLNPRHFPEE